jgi:tRNA(Ile)-lysidine synthase
VLPVLDELSPAAERNIALTSRLLADEADVLDAVVDEALAKAGFPAASLRELRSLPPALARLALRTLAERAAGRDLPLSREDADRVLALGSAGSQSLDLGGGVRAIAEYGTLRFTTDPDAAAPEAVPLPIPGSVRFGAWEVQARPGGGGDVVLVGDTLGPLAMVRSWQPGDRMRPLGLGGSKSLQDLFTDRKVPRALRRTLPVVEAGGEIVWVAGVAVGEKFTPAHSGWDWLSKDDSGLVSLSAKRVGS